MRTPRRGFLGSLLATPLLPAAIAAPQAAPAPPQPPPTPSPSPSPSAQALAEVVRQRWGAQLTPEDLDEVRRTIDGNLKAAERLRAVKLGNADEPVTRFDVGQRKTQPQRHRDTERLE
jgi:hypothetical protein